MAFQSPCKVSMFLPWGGNSPSPDPLGNRPCSHLGLARRGPLTALASRTERMFVWHQALNGDLLQWQAQLAPCGPPQVGPCHPGAIPRQTFL